MNMTEALTDIQLLHFMFTTQHTVINASPLRTFSIVFSLGPQANEIVPLSDMVDHIAPVNPFEKEPHRYIQICFYGVSKSRQVRRQ